MKGFRKSGLNLRNRLPNSGWTVAVVFALAIFTLVLVFPAMAQEKDSGFMLEEVTVTGSRIRTAEGVGASVFHFVTLGSDHDNTQLIHKNTSL